MGNSTFFPTGKLGDAMVARELEELEAEADLLEEIIANEAVPAQEAVVATGLRDLAAFSLLYENQWSGSNPTGVVQGTFTNCTQDLAFSMERLSVNPFSLMRLDPSMTTLPFPVDEQIVIGLTGMDLNALHSSGRLFLVDHSSQAPLPRIPNRYAAACSAYFYIHPASGQFLPLAIKTNVGADLIHTPLDSQYDWLLAKMMFNVNDVFFAEVFHLPATHSVAETVQLAALRTLADRHPVRGFLDRIMYRAYGVRPAGARYLVNKGGSFDRNFAISSEGVFTWEAESYAKVAGLFQGNYLDTWFASHGLMNCSYGPDLEHFPYLEEASTIVASLRSFTTAFVDSYYTDEKMLFKDDELQAWIKEVNGPAKILDFPRAPLTEKRTLIDILTQMTYLTGVMHHALNSGTLAASWTLPMHPAALYAPLPTTKNIPDMVSFLPNISKSIDQIAEFNSFSRPNLINKTGDLMSMFANAAIVDSGSQSVKVAAKRLEEELEEMAEKNARKWFDEEGLSQGMPFVWRGLDPRRIPFFLTI